MSISKILQKLQAFAKRRPLIFNSAIYGVFYTGAEFAQQSYWRMYKVPEPATTYPILVTRTSDTSDTPLFTWVKKFNNALGLADEEDTTRSGRYNWAQLKRYAIYGCFFAGPLLHGWYKWLDAFLVGKSIWIVLVKLFADQFILTPPLIAMFFAIMSIMEGKSDVFGECKIKFLHTFATSCMFWLPVQFLNFLLVPAAFRVFFVSVAAFCWVNILCYLKSIPLHECEKSKTKY